ncbi:hypothetical protein Dimus_014485 [Dionaea muscipula]
MAGFSTKNLLLLGFLFAAASLLIASAARDLPAETAAPDGFKENYYGGGGGGGDGGGYYGHDPYYGLFAQFGVVKDVFVPRKRSKSGKRFGFVRYDCSVAAEVALHKTNGLWIGDKALKVKMAAYNRNMESRWGKVEAMKRAPIGKTAITSAQARRHAQPNYRWVPKDGGNRSCAKVALSGDALRLDAANIQKRTGFSFGKNPIAHGKAALEVTELEPSDRY